MENRRHATLDEIAAVFAPMEATAIAMGYSMVVVFLDDTMVFVGFGSDDLVGEPFHALAKFPDVTVQWIVRTGVALREQPLGSA